MSAWALSVTGAVLLCTLAEIIMAEGETKKFIRGILGVTVLFVMIAPLPSLLKGERFHAAETEDTPSVNEDYMETLFEKRFHRLEERAESVLKEIGIEKAEVMIAYDFDKRDFSTEIRSVTVRGIAEETGHIDNSVIVERVARAVGVDEKIIRVER